MTTERQQGSLVFHWKDEEQSTIRLMLCLIATAVLGIGFFFLFRVVYPQTRHAIATPQQILVLDTSVPAARSLINRIRDHDSLLVEADAVVASADSTLENSTPVFKPSFQGYQMRLFDVPRTTSDEVSIRLFNADLAPLPPMVVPAVTLAAHPAETALKRQILRPVFSGDVINRRVKIPLDLDSIPIIEPYFYRYRIGVDHFGRVAFAVPIPATTSGETDAGRLAITRQVRQALQSMRFFPVSEQKIQWGELSFRWEDAPQ